jgi:MFS family permease
VVLGLGFLGVFGGVGLGRFGYGAILPSMQQGLRISSASAGALASWNLGGYVLMVAIGGVLAYRFGPRLVVGIGSLVAAVGMFLTGMAGGMISASAARLLTGLGSGAVLVPSVALMSSWFDTNRRGMASGIVATGPALAMVIAGPAVPAVIADGGADGWRLAWYFFAGLTFVVAVVTLVFQRNRPYEVAPAPDAADPVCPAAPAPTERGFAGLRHILSTRYAWHIGIAYTAFGFAYMIYLTFFQRRLIHDLGLSDVTAGRLFLLLGAASLVCGFLWGTVSDRIGRGPALALNAFLQAIGAGIFAWWPTTPGIIISVLLCGFTAMAIPGIVGAGCGDRFGPALASASLGFVTIFLGLGQVLGPYLAGRMADAFGSLKYSYVLAGGMYLVGAVLAVFLRETEWATAKRERRDSAGSGGSGDATG